MIKRQLQTVIDKYINSGKIIIIYGARQVGKTTLIKSLFNEKDTIFLNCDDPPVVETLTKISLAELNILTVNKMNNIWCIKYNTAAIAAPARGPTIGIHE